MQGLTLAAITFTEKRTLVLEEYVKGNYYARFDTHSYHYCRETHFNARLDGKS